MFLLNSVRFWLNSVNNSELLELIFYFYFYWDTGREGLILERDLTDEFCLQTQRRGLRDETLVGWADPFIPNDYVDWGADP